MGANTFTPANWSQDVTGQQLLGANHVQFNFQYLIDQLEQMSNNVKLKIQQIRSKNSSMSITDMFEVQLLMNQLSQISEMTTNLISALNSAISRAAGNMKG